MSEIHALVADDDPISRGLVSEQLSRLGVTSVMSVESGRSALRVLRRSDRVNLVVTDLRMPDLDGIALIGALEEFRERVSVIIMSALGDKILRAAAKIGVGHNLRVVGVTGKPVSSRRMASLVDLVYRRPQAATGRKAAAGDIDSESILAALREDAHAIVVQPEIRAADLKLSAVEVLSRWHHADLTGQSPANVILCAEKAGIIDQLTAGLIIKVGQAWRLWSSQRLSPKIAINISAHSMSDPSFPDVVQKLLAHQNLGPQDITFELTETAVPSAGTGALEVAVRLGMLGYGLSIDDFGTGFANLRQLQEMPFQQLKIDRSFVSQIERHADARAIIQSSIRMAHDLGMSTVGEGIENKQQQRIMTDLGCDLLQGYFFAKPMPPEELAQWRDDFQLPGRNAA